MVAASTVKKIAIVDDDQVFQMIVKKQLYVNKVECELLSFFNGQEAYDYLKSNEDNLDTLPEFVMLDVNMPVKDGWDFIDDYKTLSEALRNRIKLYLVTSSVMKSDIERAKKEVEIVNYVNKPVSSQRLVELFGEEKLTKQS